MGEFRRRLNHASSGEFTWRWRGSGNAFVRYVVAAGVTNAAQMPLLKFAWTFQIVACKATNGGAIEGVTQWDGNHGKVKDLTSLALDEVAGGSSGSTSEPVD